MSVLIQYLVKLSVSLAIVWLFYQLVLRKLTFYNSNRWYLAGYTLLSFIIPFININPVLENNSGTGNGIVKFIPSIQQYTTALEDASQCPVPIWSTNYDKWDWIAFGLMTGAGIFLLRFIIRCLSFFRIRRKAKLIYANGVKLYQVDDHIIPFSFGNAVFINSELHTEAELQEIIRHEFVHVKQKHTADIIWSEWLCIINWYNPFAWLLKASIRQNLEFIADNKVLENGVNKKQYQYLLLKVIGNNQFSIASKFNFSSLKKRIAMMNRLKSARMHLVRFLFILPLLAVILISFRKQIGKQPPVKQEKKTYAANVPTPSIDEWSPAPSESEKDFLKRHPKIKDINWAYIISVSGSEAGIAGKPGDAIMTINFTNGNWDMYNLGKAADVEKFKKNYGEMPPDAPPPPAATAPPAYYTDSVPSVREPNDKGYYIDVVDARGNCVLVIKDKNYKEVESVLLTKWKENRKYYEDKYGEIPPPPEVIPPVAPVPPDAPPIAPAAIKLPADIKSINVTNNKAVVQLKNGTSKTYDLNIPDQKEAFEKKYGKLPIPPVPPAAPIKTLPPTPPTPPAEPTELRETGESNITRVSKDFEITNDKAVIKLKNGTIEKYDLKNSDQRAAFEKKYGRLIDTHVSTSIDMAPVAIFNSDHGQTVIAPVAVSSSADVLVVDDYGHAITGHEDILVTITSKTTRDQLEEFKKQMKEKGIELKFDNVDYNDGKLVSISGSMKSKEGQSNFNAIDFSKLTLAMIKDGDRTYFKVHVTDTKVAI